MTASNFQPQRRGDSLLKRIGILIDRAWRFALTPAVLGIARSFGFNGLIVLLNLAFITLAARGLGAHDFGTFSILFSAAGLCSIFATFGQQVLLLRSWHEYGAAHDLPRLKGALIFAFQAFAVATGVAGAIYVFVAAAFYGFPLAAITSAYMAMLALATITTHLARTALGMEMGDGVVGIVAISLPLAYLLSGLFQGEPRNVEALFALHTVGFALAILVQSIAVYRKIKRDYPGLLAATPLHERSLWLGRSFRLWVSTGLEAANQYLDVILVGVLMNPSTAGAYFVVTRLANMNATAASAMHMFSTRHLPDLYYRSDHAGLSRMLDTIARVTLVVIGLSTLALLGGGYWLLQIFNPLYTVYYPALAILTLATAAVAMIGPSGAVLMFAGHERNFLRITATTLAIRLVAFLVLVPLFSLNGAVTATVCAFLAMTVLTRSAAYRLAGFDCSVIRLMAKGRP